MLLTLLYDMIYNKTRYFFDKMDGDFVIYYSTAQRMEQLNLHGFCAHIANKETVLMHGHSFLEFTYVDRGVIEHTFANTTEILKQGDYFIVDYGTKHGYKSADGNDISVINLLFYPDFIDRTLLRKDNFERVVNSYLVRFKYRMLDRSPDGIRFFDDGGRVRSIVDSIINEFTTRETGYLECIRCQLAQILIMTMRKISKQEAESEPSDVIKLITDDVKRNYSGRLTLSEYAKRYNYSLSHISKKFTDEMGMGFTQYLQRIRIEQACRLLEEGRLSVGEISGDVGYDNVKFFNRVFKNSLGVTPREFKKMSK